MFAGVGAITSAVRTLANFDEAINRAGVISGATADQFALLTERARELGATTRFTATDAAQGLTFLAQAGFTVAESLETVDDSLRLAQIGNLSLAESADIATNVLTGFNLGVEEAERFVNVLAKAATTSNTNVRQLGEAFSFVAPIAQGVGVSIEEAAAAIGILSDAGIQGSRAGTGFQRVISRLSNPTKQAQEVLTSLGLTVADVSVETRGLEDVLVSLAESGISATQSLVLAGDRGGPAIVALTEGVEKLGPQIKNLTDLGDFSKEAAAALDDNLLGSLRRVASAFEAVILAIGASGGTGGLRGLLDGLADVLRTAAENIDTVIAFARNLAIVLGPRVLLGAVRLLTAAIAANPIGLIAVGIAAAITAIPELQTALNSLIETLNAVGTALFQQFDFTGRLTTLAANVDSVIATFRGLFEAAGVIFDNLGERPEEVGELIKKGFRDAVEASLDFFLAFAQTVGNILTGIGEDVISVTTNAIAAAANLARGRLDVAQSFADNAESAVTRAANRVTTFAGQFENNLSKLNAVELLPEVEISEGARELGNTVAQEFARGFQESGTPVSDAVAGALQRGAQRGASGAGPVVTPGGGSEIPRFFGPEGKSGLDQANDQVFTLQEQIDALDKKTNFGSGISRGLLRMQQEAQDLAAVGEKVANVFADTATDAIVKFVETGEFNFKEFANEILRQLLRIIVRLLVVQALSAAFGGVAGQAGSAAASAAAGNADGRAAGGPVQRDRPFIVGEDGPELFTPSTNGSITPAGQTAAMMQSQPPVVNVINVKDESEIPESINSGKADAAIINVLARNRDQVRRVTS